MKILLQKILFPSDEFCKEEELYYHESESGRDFDGYFNLFYIEKRKVYTDIERVFLSLTLQGYCSLRLMHNRDCVEEIFLAAAEEKKYEIELPYHQYEKGVFWFSLREDKAAGDKIVSGEILGEISEEKKREINIGAVICTYRREDYIERNIGQLKRLVFDNVEIEAASHLQIYIVDNGKTLSQNAVVQEAIAGATNKIRIIPNKNAGGSGGFTRGMMEAIDEKDKKELSHVLLMDDDALVEPDAIIRLYGILCTLKEEWKEITVGGEMLREEFPHILFASGEGWENGRTVNPNAYTDLREYSSVVKGNLAAAFKAKKTYSGWWFCCFSLDTVKRDNLPLPLFIHHDDIEYGLRNCNAGIVFFNGVGVWHRGWETIFQGSNLYYYVRNTLIELSFNGRGNRKKAACRMMLKHITSSALRLRYQDIKIIVRAMEDFLRGPDWLCAQDPDELNQSVRRMGIQMESMDSIYNRLPKKEREELEKQLKDYKNSYGVETILQSGKDKKNASRICYLTYNGWLLPADKKGIKLLTATDSPFAGYRKKKLCLYEPGSGKAQIAERDYKKLGLIISAYVRSLVSVWKRFDQISAAYNEKKKTFTNYSFWKEYLERP